MSQSSTVQVNKINRRQWLGLIVLLTGAFLPPLDFFIVNVALPAIRDDLQAASSMMQLVVSGYATTYAAMLITGGRLGDLYGRRTTFLSGMALFAVASIICGAAWSPASLIAGRVLQGFAAAVMAPQALASINSIFSGTEKSIALSMYSLTFGLASTTGLFLSGLLIAFDIFGLGWRSIFLINVPIIALAMPAAFYFVEETRSPLPKQIDIGGALLIAFFLLSLIVPLIEGADSGWPAWSILLLMFSCPLAVLVWRHESKMERTRRDPIFPPSLLGTPGLMAGLFSALMFYTLAAFWLVFSLYQQSGLNRSPLEAGLSIVPAAAGFIVGPLVNPWIAARCGTYAAAAGMVMQAAGLFGTSLLAATGLPEYLIVPLFLIGMGQGIALPNLVGNIIGLVDRQSSGLASGLVSSIFQISGALAVAIIGGLFFRLAGSPANAKSIAVSYSICAIAISSCLLIAAWHSFTPSNDRRK